MNLKAVLFVATLFSYGYASKSPLTTVDPKDVVNYHVNRVVRTHDKTFQNNLAVFHNLASKIFIQSSEAISNNSCARSLKKLENDFTSSETYALKILDSWGKPESGILEGNFVWEGRYYECINAHDEGNITGHYCNISLNLPTTLSPLGSYIAACFPDTCSVQDISALLSFLPPGVVDGVNCLSSKSTWMAKDILGIVVLCVLGFLVVCSTLYDCFTDNQVKKSQTLDDENSYSITPPQIDTTEKENFLSPRGRKDFGASRRVKLSFSVIRNTKLLLDTTQRPTDITCLHGLRFISMTWVILGHTFLFPLSYTDNLVFLAQYTVDHYEFQALTNAFFSVDSFFFLSGLLVVYLGLRQLHKSEGKMNVLLMYFHRYIRLTPPYAFLILISISLYPKLGEGPFWSISSLPMVETCQKYWYTNLLYFNNLYPASIQNECWAWGWYLANDTQFYLLAPLFLWFLYRYPKVGLGLISFVLLASISITGAFSSHTKQQPTAMLYGLMAESVVKLTSGGKENLITASQTSYSPYMEDLYGKPWCRIGAYLVGMITGYVLHATGNKLKMNKIIVVVGWVAASVVNFLLVYCCYPYYSKGEPFNNNLAVFYNAVSRPVWCVGLAWVVLACVNGYGGPVNKLLSWKAFIPLSRLTYCTYLLHPLVLDWFVGAEEVQQHFSIYSGVMLFVFAVVFTTMLAYVVAMLAEFPFVQLLKILQSNNKRYETAPPKDENNDQNPLLASS